MVLAERQPCDTAIEQGGLAPASGLTRLMASQLFEVTATDPATFLGVAVLLLGVAAAACLLAAWRVTRANPVGALRGAV